MFRRILVGLLALALGAPILTPAPAQADPPPQPACLPLGAGSTGLLLVGGQIPSLTGFLGGGEGFGPVANTGRLNLPKRVVFADGKHAISNEYAFALRRQRLFVIRATEGRPVRGARWHRMELPSCLAGRITAVSADHRLLTVTTTDRQLYSHDMPNGDLSPERWTWRWGPFLWLGAGMKMFRGVRDWSISEFNSAETFRDTAGRKHHPIGVATGYLLRGDRRTITYIDPWLPTDQSREVCGPLRGRLRLASLDASGSTIFAAATDGSLWTRLYDFDLSGANSLVGSYTWQYGVNKGSSAWQLPAPSWVRHNSPPGVVTDRLTIVKTGKDAVRRELRIEGRDRAGHRGYWRKALTAKRWHFVRTGARLQGKVLKRARDLAGSLNRRYVGTIAGRRAVIGNFNPVCSGANLVVTVGQHRLRLRLHSEDALRQMTRARRLTHVPRTYNAAIEVPAATWKRRARLPKAARRFLTRVLDGRVTELPIAVTRTRLRLPYQCWQFTLNGRPAHADAVGNPVDVATLLGFLHDVPAQETLPTC